MVPLAINQQSWQSLHSKVPSEWNVHLPQQMSFMANADTEDRPMHRAKIPRKIFFM
jgi:hypothetical protein